MPRKGEKLSEEQKKAMAEGRKRQQEAEAEAVAADEAATAEIEAQKAAEQQAAIERAQEQRRAMLDEANTSPRIPDGPIHLPTFEPSGEGTDQGVREWGPYGDYTIVQTPYGSYAVEPGYVMFFEPYEFFDDREKRMRTSHRPVYVWARNDSNKGKTRDELVRGLPAGVRSKPKVATPTS